MQHDITKNKPKEYMARSLRRQVEQQRRKKGIIIGSVGILFNIVLGIFKLIIGSITKSVSITSDAANNLADSAASFMTVISFILGGRTADKDHPNGHGRYEYLAGLIIGILIIVVGLQFAISSVGKIINPEAVKFSWPLIYILIASVIINTIMAIVYRHMAKSTNSSALKASAADSLFDSFITTAVIIGFIIGQYTTLPVDGIVGLTVSVIIVYGGLRVAFEVVGMLLGKSADDNLTGNIKKIILSQEEIVGTHDLNVHDYGPCKIMGSIHAEFKHDLRISEAHKIIDKCESEVKHQLGVDLVIHCDIIDNTDEDTRRVSHIIWDIIREFDGMTIHDVKIDYTSNTVSYYLACPICHKKSLQHITYKIEQEILQKLQGYEVIIEMDYV